MNFTENLLSLYEQVSPDLHEAGVRWYHDVRRWSETKAVQHGTTPWQVAAVIALLSPRTEWKRNLLLAGQVLYIWSEGGSVWDALELPYLKRNIGQAWGVLTGEFAPHAPKTTAFCDNIANLDSPAVTVDIWAVRAAWKDFEAPYLKVHRGLVTTYEDYVAAYLEGSAQVGLRGYEFQAVIWVWVKYFTTSMKRRFVEQLTLF